MSNPTQHIPPNPRFLSIRTNYNKKKHVYYNKKKHVYIDQCLYLHDSLQFVLNRQDENGESITA